MSPLPTSVNMLDESLMPAQPWRSAGAPDWSESVLRSLDKLQSLRTIQNACRLMHDLAIVQEYRSDSRTGTCSSPGSEPPGLSPSASEPSADDMDQPVLDAEWTVPHAGSVRFVFPDNTARQCTFTSEPEGGTTLFHNITMRDWDNGAVGGRLSVKWQQTAHGRPKFRRGRCTWSSHGGSPWDDYTWKSATEWTVRSGRCEITIIARNGQSTIATATDQQGRIVEHPERFLPSLQDIFPPERMSMVV